MFLNNFRKTLVAKKILRILLTYMLIIGQSIICFGQTIPLQNFGKYKWVKNNQNAAPILLKTTCVVKDITKSIVKKENEKTPQKKVSFIKNKLVDGPIKYKSGQAYFTGKPLKAIKELIVKNFVYRDNATANITYTDKAHGFIINSAFDVIEDSDNNIWLLGEEGLVKYDGIRAFLYNKASGLPSVKGNELFYDSQERIWMNTEEGCYYIKNDSCFTMETKLFNVKTMLGHDIAEDKEGNIWLSTSNMGAISIQKNNNLLLLDITSGLPDNNIQDISFDNKGRLYLSMLVCGFCIVDNEGITNFKFNDKGNQEPWILSAISKNDTTYIGTWNRGIIRMTKMDTILFSQSGRFSERIYKVIFTNRGICYSVYCKGVVFQNGDLSECYSKENGLVGNMSWGIFFDSFHNLWVCDIASGISRINENVFYKTQKTTHLTSVTKISYSPDKKHKWYFFNGRDVEEEKDSIFIRYSVKNSTPTTLLQFVFDGYINNDNEVWGASYACSGICKIKNEKAWFYFISENDEERVVNSVLPSNDKKIWFTTERFGVVYYDEVLDKFYQKNISNGALSNSCSKLNTTAEGDLVCLFQNGMQKIEGSDLYDFKINDSLFDTKITNVLARQNGTTLLSTDSKGLLLLDQESVYLLNSKNGLVSNNVFSLFEDGERIWVLTDKGVQRIIINAHNVTYERCFDNNYGLFMETLGGFCTKMKMGT